VQRRAVTNALLANDSGGIGFGTDVVICWPCRRPDEKLCRDDCRRDPAICGGSCRVEAVKAADADGSVMLLAPLGFMMLFPHVYKTLRYEPLGFYPGVYGRLNPTVLTVGPKVPGDVRTLAGFVAWCAISEHHLRHLLLSHMKYYNGARTHLSLEKYAPFSRAVDRAGHILCRPIPGRAASPIAWILIYDRHR